MKKVRIIGLAALIAVWAALTLGAWLKPADDVSESERRNLAQFPELTVQTVLNGKFMTNFEDYTLDQFPLRDTFRQMKALFHYNALGQKDNNGIYITDGYAGKQEYPLNESSVIRAASRFEYLYKKYLADTGSAVFMTVVPDKGQYLAEENGNLKLDIEEMMHLLEEQMPWATHVDLTDSLSAEDYYRTDTHWRQENLLNVAGVLCDALGAIAPAEADYSPTTLERPFYGVYYGQAALPLEPDMMLFLQSPILDACTTYVAQIDPKTGEAAFQKLYDGVYDMAKFDGKDMYEGFLSGTQGILRIENPNPTTDRELIMVRDSFGSAIAPLLVQGYRSVTLVDIRSVQIDFLDKFIDFHGQDVLFLYSTLVLNNSSTLK